MTPPIGSEAARVLDGLGLHMLLLAHGVFEVVEVAPPAIDATLALHPGLRVTEAVAAVCSAIDNRQLNALSFARRDTWGELQHLVTVEYVLAGTLWQVRTRVVPAA